MSLRPSPTQSQWRRMVQDHQTRVGKRPQTRRKLPTKILILPIAALAIVSYLTFQNGLPETLAGWPMIGSTGSGYNTQDKPPVLRGGNALNSGVNRPSEPPSTTSTSTVSGPVTHVRDGDTIEVSGKPIRFAKLDCDETGTIKGDAATRRMRSLVSSKALSCSLTGRRSYDRWIGSCRLSDGRDVAGVMISTGACKRWH
jgi:hypothetical protein